MGRIASFLCVALYLVAFESAAGAPILRLNVPGALRLNNGDVRPVWIPAGTNGPTDLSFEAWNNGDGELNLAVSGGASAWLKPELGDTAPCSFDGAKTCHQVKVLFDAAGLPNGVYQGEVEVSDAGAADAPQRAPVKIYVGGNVPEGISFYVRPAEGSADWLEFQTPEGLSPEITTSSAGQFLSVSSSGLGSFRFLHTHRVTGEYRTGLGEGDHEGSLTINGSSFGPDNRAVPVTLHVTTQPIARLSAKTLRFSTAQGLEVEHPDVQQTVALSNRGDGTLTVSGIEIETEDGGEWLSTEDLGEGAYLVKAAAGDLAPGFYNGTVRFNSNAANSPSEVAVSFEVQPQTGPRANFRGLVNGASFDASQPLAPGTIVSLFGSQLAYDAGTNVSRDQLPLPTTLLSTKVLIHGIEAPLFFVSYRQINLQIPFEVPEGVTTVQVMRDGEMGNQITANIGPRSPGIFIWPGLFPRGIITNFSQGNCPMPPDVPCPLGTPSAPARPGDFLVIWATGVSPVTPSVPTGGAAPGQEPLARAQSVPLVRFGNQIFSPVVAPAFAGLAPGFVGLFQVNVPVPLGISNNPQTAITLEFSDGRRSNTVTIATER